MPRELPVVTVPPDDWHGPTRPEHRAWKPSGRHRPTAIRNVNDLDAERLTTGQRIADAAARNLGSWRFILLQTCLLAGWVVVNVAAWVWHWDPYPFILLNLALSFQAAYSAPIIMMSQNRQAAKDWLTAEHDDKVTVRAEEEVAAIRAKLDELAAYQWEPLLTLQREQTDVLVRIEALARALESAGPRTPPAPPGSDLD